MNPKRIYFSRRTPRIMKKVLPDTAFKMTYDKTSNGYKLVNAAMGIEIDMLYDFLDQATHSISPELFDYGKDSEYSEVIIKDRVVEETVYGDNNPIKITNRQEFYDGSPTRLESVGTINISGVPFGIIGVEYLRTTPEGEGFILFNVDATIEECIASGIHQSYKLPTNDLAEQLASGLIYMSGIDPSKYTHSYDNIGRDEVLTPPSYGDMIRMYSDTITLKLPKDGDEDNALQSYNVVNWKPDGYYWDTVNEQYIPVSYPTDKYINSYSLEEEYHRVSLNNPSGSGVYDTVYLDLIDIPISGTLRLYDIDNLTISGVPHQISESGTQSYYHDGMHDGEQYSIYIGYSGIVPHEYLPLGASGIYADPYRVTSWSHVYENDGLDGNFQWQTDPTKPITNKIKIVNPIARYIVEYDSKTENGIKYITTPYSSRYVRYDDRNYIFSSTPNGSGVVNIDASISNEKENRIAITFNGLDVRPGTRLVSINLGADIKLTGNTNKSITIPADDTLIGAEDVMVPNVQDRRSYIFNDYPVGTTFTPGSGILTNVIFDNYLAPRITTDHLYVGNTTYYPLFVPNNVNDRCFRTRFRLTSYNSSFTIARSEEDDNNFWSLSLDNGYFVIKDYYGTYYSYNPMSIDNNIKEVILVSNTLYNNTYNNDKYSLYYKDGDKFFKFMPLGETEVVTYTVSSELTEFFIDVNADVDYIMLYDEQGDFNV